MKFVPTHREPIRPGAAKPARPYRHIHRAADIQVSRLAQRVRRSLTKFRDTIEIGPLMDLLQAGDVRLIEAYIPWAELGQKFLPTNDIFRQILEDAGKGTEAQARNSFVRKADLRAELTFNGQDPLMERWAREQSGTMIEGITTTSLETVREAVAEAIRTGRDYGTSAQKIKDAVGLTSRDATALSRFRDSFAEGGFAASYVERQVESYRERLLKGRAESISRTETISAANEGAIAYWEQLISSGVVPREKVGKGWLVTPDDRLCPICERIPSDNGIIGINDKFMTEVGPLDRPTAHPNCRCALYFEVM